MLWIVFYLIIYPTRIYFIMIAHKYFTIEKAPTRPKSSEGINKRKEPAILSSKLFRQAKRLRTKYPVHIGADGLLGRFDCRLCRTSVFTITCNRYLYVLTVHRIAGIDPVYEHLHPLYLCRIIRECLDTVTVLVTITTSGKHRELAGIRRRAHHHQGVGLPLPQEPYPHAG